MYTYSPFPSRAWPCARSSRACSLSSTGPADRFKLNLQTLIIYKLGFNENQYTFTLMFLTKIVVCSELP